MLSFLILSRCCFFFFSSRRRHTRCSGVSWARDVYKRQSRTDPTKGRKDLTLNARLEGMGMIKDVAFAGRALSEWSDEELVAMAKNGDKEATARLLTRY